ncbi:MAG: N-acyl-D-glucosamine 2-epimerase [Moorea sp. SIO1G6]|nr:N-acyl-D-glucosamine 2-epimerase [Moorena sp. SIO1G6]
MLKKFRKNKFAFSLITSLIILILCCFYTVFKPILAQQNTEITMGQQWLQHLEEDLNPWWLMETAYGKPVGNFPSFRCDNGDLVNPSKPCSAFTKLGDNYGYITNNLDKNYIVSQSRQVYTYCVAYHLSGNPKFLSLAKAGIDWIRNYGLDRENGGAFSYLKRESRQSGPSVLKRTSQELAYALQGMAFYYYLTQDQELLPEIIQLKNFIFETYYDPKLEMMMWVPKQVKNENVTNNWLKQKKHLLSQLDQIYTYMLILAPILPEPYQSEWKQDLLNLSSSIINEFYSPEYNTFWMEINNIGEGKLPTDYGHSMKAFWMIYLTGKLFNNQRFIDFAQIGASRMLEEAYDVESGLWGRGISFDENDKGVRDLDKKWWVYAELDQMAGTLSLEDSSYVDKYLKSTVNWWLKNMVDHTNHGVWNLLTWPTLEKQLPKQYHWKNGFHSHEHALVGYITSQANQGEKVKLYFARKKGKEKENIKPYYYTGEIVDINRSPMPSITDSNLPSLSDLNRVIVSFTGIK